MGLRDFGTSWVLCGWGVVLMYRILLVLVVMVVYGFYLCSTGLCCVSCCFGLSFVQVG